jgi:ABC-2 type transport system permease protein
MAMYLVAAVIGGVLLEAAIQTFVSILAFRFTIPIAVFMWFDRMIATFGNYPFSILPLAARAVLTYLLPVAFVAYLPAAVLTGRVASTGVPQWLAYASPAAGPLLYILARYAWYSAVRTMSPLAANRTASAPCPGRHVASLSRARYLARARAATQLRMLRP